MHFPFAFSLVSMLLLSNSSPVLGAAGYCSTTTSIKKIVQSGDFAYIYWIDYPAFKTSSGSITTDCNMNNGATGSGVRSLQQSLNSCYGESLDVDGDYGPKTKAAVKRTQKKIHAAQDGIWGPETGSLMNWDAGSPNGGGRRCLRAGTSA